MKNINLLNIFILIFVFSDFILAQFRYVPLELGNVWVYEIYDGTRRRAEIVDSSVFIDSIMYFGYGIAYQTQYSGAIRLRSDDFYVVREDSTFPEPNNERKYYKRNAQLGDTWQVNYGHTVPAIYTITDTFPAYTFDTLVTGKLLNENFGLVEWDYIWTEEFGQLAQFDEFGGTQYYLRGCVINGAVFGDTTFIVVSVNDVTAELAYELFQNYPNPFNSSTIISFTIPENDNVILELCNLLGEKIEILIDEPVNAGKHTVHFEAKDLVSGIYFYVLKATNYIQTKKMLLIK